MASEAWSVRGAAERIYREAYVTTSNAPIEERRLIERGIEAGIERARLMASGPVKEGT